MDLGFKILIAVLMGYMIYRLWPHANNWLKKGPKGSQKDWMGVALILLGIIGFVALLIFMVRKS